MLVAVRLPAVEKTWARPRYKCTYFSVCQSHKLWCTLHEEHIFILKQADNEYESENTMVGRYKPVIFLFMLNHRRPSIPWFGTPLPSGVHPECRYEVWNETVFKRNTQMAYILNPVIDSGLNLDPRELYFKLITILNIMFCYTRWCVNTYWSSWWW
jgi:hypothetical protein